MTTCFSKELRPLWWGKLENPWPQLLVMGFKNSPILMSWWEICPAAWVSGFLGSRPYRWLTASPRLCFLASVSLACSVDAPHLLCRVLIGVRSFELLRWKRLGKQHPIIIPSQVRRGSRGWLLSYCSSHRSLLKTPLCSGCPNWKQSSVIANSVPLQNRFS